ncbi:MAG TPA: hypothetical protein VMP08_10295 [Anaerolineae bacterium]|nr:hypothetical protein [Anaerolineae bacterium]
MKLDLIRTVIACLVTSWLMFAQPGVSPYALIDPAVHAAIDAEVYGQTIDGQPLPGHEHDHHLPHNHPGSSGLPTPNLSLQNVFDDAFYLNVFAPAKQRALSSERCETAVIAESITLVPLDPPPRG